MRHSHFAPRAIHHQAFFGIGMILVGLVFSPARPAAAAAVPIRPSINFAAYADRAGTSTLVQTLQTVETIRARHASVRDAAPEALNAWRAERDIFILSKNLLTTPPLLLHFAAPLAAQSDAPGTATLASRQDTIQRERLAEETLALCAAAALRQAGSPLERRHWVRQLGPDGAQRLYREAGVLLAATLDTLADVPHRNQVFKDAPPALRSRLILLAKLHELYREEPPGMPPRFPRQTGAPAAAPLFEKPEPAWQSLHRRIQAFQSVIPTDLLQAEPSGAALPDRDAALAVAQRQWAGLSIEERRRSQALWERAGAGAAGIRSLYEQSCLGPASWRELIALAEAHDGDPSAVAVAAAWNALTESPDLIGKIMVQQAGGVRAGPLRLVFVPAPGEALPLMLAPDYPWVVVDLGALVPPLPDAIMSRAYQGTFRPRPAQTQPPQLSPGNPEARPDFRRSILRDVPGDAFVEKRLNLAPYVEEQLAPRLREAGLTTEHPQWAVRRDLLLQPFFQSQVRQYVLGEGPWAGDAAHQIALARRPEGFEAWLVEQLKRDYAASLEYHQRSKSWQGEFEAMRDALLGAPPGAELWQHIVRLQRQFESAAADALAGLAKE